MDNRQSLFYNNNKSTAFSVIQEIAKLCPQIPATKKQKSPTLKNENSEFQKQQQKYTEENQNPRKQNFIFRDTYLKAEAVAAVGLVQSRSEKG